MPWFKVDDTLAFNSKVVTAGNDAMGLWVRAASWCSSQLLDGFVPTVMANAMANRMANGEDIASLVSSGLWDEAPGGYQFHDWSDYQPSGAAVKETRKRRSEAGKRGADARWGEAEPMAPAMANAMANRMAPAMAKRCPVPSRPEKDTSELRPDIDALLDHLDQRIASNGAKTPARTAKNTGAMRLLLDRDGREPDEVRRVIDWAADSTFWRGNILSASKLREKYDTLRLQMDRDQPTAGRPWRADYPEDVF